MPTMYKLDEMLTEVKRLSKSDTIMISFSGGKDSWGMWCALKDKIDFELYHYYGAVPGLEYEDTYLDYCERKIGKRIIRLPAWNIYALLAGQSLAAVPPNRVPVQWVFNLPPNVTHEDVQALAIEIAGLPETTYTAIGLRAADSTRRAMVLRRHGVISENVRKFYPIWDWNKAKLLDELKRNDVRLPPDYYMFGRSLDGVNYRFVKGIKDNFPNDYKKILEYLPFHDMDLYRYEKREQIGY